MNDLDNRIAGSFEQQGFMTTMGAQLYAIKEGEVQVMVPFSQTLSQQRGYLHGGAISTILDTACGYAALTRAPADNDVVTVEFKINFIRPAIGERFLAIGKVVTAGKRLSVCTGEVFAIDGEASKVVAIMQATIANVPHEKAS
jgi:uncharacterized protein (TIGR00369 family)